jgi:DNA polymerase III subunit beta
MKFIALRSNVKDAITIVEKAAGENTSLPILKNILIKAENNTITFTTTNLEVAITHKLAGKVIEDGVLTVPLSLFSNIITNIQSDRLNFEKKENNFEITTDNYSAVLNGIAADDFPKTPEIKNTEGFIEIKNAFLKEGIQQATVASQYSDLRPELNSVLFSFSLESLILASTDGFRLAEKSIPASQFTVKKKDPFKILVPLRAALEAARVVRDDAVVRIYQDENQVLFKTEDTEMISRLIEGSFPDYSAIVPSEFSAEIVVERDELMNAIKLAGVFGMKNSEMKIAINTNRKAIEISSADQTLGTNSTVLPAKIKGDIPEVFFNWRYLSDPMKSIKGEDVFLGLQEEAGPALLRAVNDTSYFYVLKPILKS